MPSRTSRSADQLHILNSDPHEIHNLAKRPEYRDRMALMRNELRRWMTENPDAYLHPIAMMYERAAARNETVYEMAKDPEACPIKSILETADLVGRGPEHLAELTHRLQAPDAGVRYPKFDSSAA